MSHIDSERIYDCCVEVASPMAIMGKTLIKIIVCNQEAGKTITVLEAVKLDNDIMKG